MRAFVVTGPGEAGVQDVPEPTPAPGEVVVDVARVGLCGTDVEFFTGEMAYLASGHARYPVRLGHEWCGVVSEVGPGVDPGWLGRRTTGDTMLGCGRCPRCTGGRQHVCADRHEVGIRGGRPGALAERLAVPVTSLHALPDSVDDTAGALVEPGANALRCVHAAAAAAGEHLLVVGPGTIGLLVAQHARAAGVQVQLLGVPGAATDFARAAGLATATSPVELPDRPWAAVVDASTGASVPAWAVGAVEAAGRVVCIGLSTTPSLVDTRALVLADVTVVGVLSGSPGLGATVRAYAAGTVDPRPLVAATVGLGQVADVLAGRRPAGAGAGPKVQVDPRL